MPTRAAKKSGLQTFNYIGLTIFALTVLYPLVLIGRIAIRPNDNSSVTFTNFRALLADPAFIHWFTNTSLLALAAAVLSVIIAATVGYSLSRSSTRCRNRSIGQPHFVTRLLPATMLLLPLYLGAVRFGMVDSYVGAILLYAATVLPLCIWLLQRCYDTIPVELEDAAILDGCSRSQSYRLVVLPLVQSALVAAALLSFLLFWTEHFILSAVGRDAPRFIAANADPNSGGYAAFTCLVCIVSLALLLILTRFQSRSLTEVR